MHNFPSNVASNDVDIEKCPPMVKFLAQVRKSGMDILFPQVAHDKILACVYSAVKNANVFTHRDVYTLVMAIIESKCIQHIENVSKTKVRGIVAFLKAGSLLVTEKEGRSGPLCFAPGINCFRDLRLRHDIFVETYIMQHHLFMPSSLKGKLIWQLDEETILKRLETIHDWMNNITEFFKGYVTMLSKHAIPGKTLKARVSNNNNDELLLPSDSLYPGDSSIQIDVCIDSKDASDISASSSPISSPVMSKSPSSITIIDGMEQSNKMNTSTTVDLGLAKVALQQQQQELPKPFESESRMEPEEEDDEGMHSYWYEQGVLAWRTDYEKVMKAQSQQQQQMNSFYTDDYGVLDNSGKPTGMNGASSSSNYYPTDEYDYETAVNRLYRNYGAVPNPASQQQGIHSPGAFPAASAAGTMKAKEDMTSRSSGYDDFSAITLPPAAYEYSTEQAARLPPPAVSMNKPMPQTRMMNPHRGYVPSTTQHGATHHNNSYGSDHHGNNNHTMYANHRNTHHTSANEYSNINDPYRLPFNQHRNTANTMHSNSAGYDGYTSRPSMQSNANHGYPNNHNRYNPNNGNNNSLGYATSTNKPGNTASYAPMSSYTNHNNNPPHYSNNTSYAMNTASMNASMNAPPPYKPSPPLPVYSKHHTMSLPSPSSTSSISSVPTTVPAYHTSRPPASNYQHHQQQQQQQQPPISTRYNTYPEEEMKLSSWMMSSGVLDDDTGSIASTNTNTTSYASYHHHQPVPAPAPSTARMPPSPNGSHRNAPAPSSTSCHQDRWIDELDLLGISAGKPQPYANTTSSAASSAFSFASTNTNVNAITSSATSSSSYYY